MSNEQQKKHDFVCDLIALSKDYGWTVDEAMEIIGFRLKTEEELLNDKN